MLTTLLDGGYQNYVALWYQSLMQQQQQQGGQGAAAGAPAPPS
jgi:far upstream element-binding protein